MDREIDLGPCCACGRADVPVRNICFLDLKAPVPGTGWGCIACGSAMDGAIAIVCDQCLDKAPLGGTKGERMESFLKSVVRGKAYLKRRMDYAAAAAAGRWGFEHDPANHPELWVCERCGCTWDRACRMPNGLGCSWVRMNLCSRCATPAERRFYAGLKGVHFK